MRVLSLNINNLRNIGSAGIEPGPGLNCFVGDNGAGKTSILEALAVLSKGRSFRPGHVSSLIGPGSDCLQLVSKVESHHGEAHQLGLERGADYWRARHQGKDINQISELTRLLPFVVLEPSSHTLISGPPDGRRKYLDWGVFHVKHDYLDLWRRYNRVLKQRNAALRQGNQGVVQSLDPQFVQLGEQLDASRRSYVALLDELLTARLPAIDPTLGQVTISYRKGWSGEKLEDALIASTQRDMDRGATHPGPHKADLHLTLDGAPARERLSRGEQKAMTAAMVIAQASTICTTGEKPLLMLDDLFSEFDDEHLSRVLQASLDLGVQVWLTGTRTGTAMEAFKDSYSLFHVEHGKVSITKT